jgi:hypothetical protein
MDPAELTFASLAEEQRLEGGPAWREAIDAGIDVTLLLRNLELSPDERLAQLDAMLRLVHESRR